MKRLLLFLLSFSGLVFAENNHAPLNMTENEKAYFVSFSIPEPQLVAVMKSAERHDIPIYIRGLIGDNLDQTAKAILYLAQKYDVQGVLVDPNRFSYYDINAVPALVKKCGDKFDVIFGNGKIEQSLELINKEGECKNDK
ncbi:type-F conjugative transfer system pilin assembly protein TrbC [Pasteurella multocida]|uniref:type-F conjugative transfer system pilin assembly protein TrbC n=1 Tax=Pasteurella multocida TaxID=747 RepID=UPI00197E7C76|nr:type-F conjugative transfer system pilin assembly protein TrbC [Pasteurella multocida]